MQRTICVSTVMLAIAALAAPIAVQADQRVLIARNDPNSPNFFSVEFPPEFGGVTTADIVSTHFAFAVDETGETASILAWYQHVNPLIIGGQSTGDITVALDGDSHGAYSEKLSGGETLEGRFRTEETYAVHFTGDLSQFGIESPFVLPGVSTGFVKYNEDGRSGRVSMNWSGEGSLGGIPFTYICAVNALFETASDSCEGVRNVRASCDENGSLRVVVKMTDASRDGDILILEVNDGVYGTDPIPVVVRGNRAKLRLQGRAGEQTVTVSSGGGSCGDPVASQCP
ncbi:MAG: hypothetical protein BroJett003_18070 [Planctomycetota bacterium]|nr:MAG: hypothetical protein BroJett003_18070 [Planctomycetota bacterium]